MSNSYKVEYEFSPSDDPMSTDDEYVVKFVSDVPCRAFIDDEPVEFAIQINGRTFNPQAHSASDNPKDFWVKYLSDDGFSSLQQAKAVLEHFLTTRVSVVPIQ